MKMNVIKKFVLSAGFACVVLAYFNHSYAIACPATIYSSTSTPVNDGGNTCDVTIEAPNGSLQILTSYGVGVSLSGNGSTFTNNGTMFSVSNSTIGVYATAPRFNRVSSITNNSQMTGFAYGILNTGNVETITNSGSITGSLAYYASVYAIYNSGYITNLVNQGTVNGVNGIRNTTGTITNLTNSATANLSPISNVNAGLIVTFNNGQGGTVNPGVNYSGTHPTNYNIIVTSPTVYGVLASSGSSGPMTFGIYSGGVAGVPASILTSGTYSGVLSGVNSSDLDPVSLSGTYGAYSWSLSLVNAISNLWDLIVSSGDTPSPSSITNIGAGASFNLSNIGVTANPVFDGGTLTLASGESSLQSFYINSTGGTIKSPNSGSASLSGVFSGTGGLTFTGSGTTVMSGANSYTGGTTVASGTLSVAGSSPTGYGDVTVNNGATLMGTGTINGNIFIAGILKPGNSPGYLASTGNVTMSAGSTYQQDIAGRVQATSSTPVGAQGYYSALNVSAGQFVINSGATLTPRLSNLFAANEAGYGSTPYAPVLGDRFRIVTASGGISGKFSAVTQPAELAAGTQFLAFYNMANSNSVDLAVIPTSYGTTISTSSGNKNAQSVGGALDRMVIAAQNGTSTAAQDQLLYATSAKNAASLSGYAQGLSGEVYPATVAVIAQTTQRVQQAVLSRLSDTMGIALPNSSPAGNTGLMGTTNTTLSGGVAGASVSTNPAVNPGKESKSLSNGNVWGDLVYQNGNRTSDSNAGGWNSNLYQLVFGSDFFTANGMKLGGGLALSNTTLNPTYGSATIQQGSVFAYGKMPIETFVVDAMASFGLSSSDILRGDVTGLGNGFRNKSVSGNDAMVALGLSRPFDTESVRITPFVRATWQIVTQSSVNEGGLASALNVNSYTGNGVRGVLGVAAGSKTNNPMTEQYTYRAYVGVGVDSSGVLNPALNASLGGLDTNITTPNAGTTFVQAGLYGTAKVSDNAYAYAGLSGEARSNQTLGNINVGLRVQF